MSTFKFLKSLFFIPLAVFNYTANATDLPFVDGFEGSTILALENFPTNPAVLQIETCPIGRTGKCLHLSNLLSRSGDYRPALYKRDFNMQNGQIYSISMQVKSDQANQFKFYVKDQTQAWLPISESPVCYINTEWSSCNYSFIANIPSGVTGPFALYLELATVTGQLWLDDVTVVSGSSSTTGGTTTQQCPTNAATCGFYTQQEIVNAANAAKLACQTNPSSCGITVSTGYTQTQLDAAKQTGIQEGINQCKNDPNCKGLSTTTVHATYANGELHVPFVDLPPDPFGLVHSYDVYLKQRSNSYTFDLDMNRLIFIK
jgi:hypothetical protein